MTPSTMERINAVRIRPHLNYFKGFPSLVPYLCVFFILMVFFMISTNFVPLRGIPVELPLGAGDLTYQAKAMIVTINKDAVIYFGDTIIPSKKELQSRISAVRSSRSAGQHKEQIIVRADIRAPLQTIAMVFSVAQELNMDAVIITQPEAQTGKTAIIEKE